MPGWRTTAAPPRPAAGLAGGGGPVARAGPGEESSSDEEPTSDDVFEKRHSRTLERAILAARSVARAMAQKERERKQAVGHHHPPVTADGAKPDSKVRRRFER